MDTDREFSAVVRERGVDEGHLLFVADSDEGQAGEVEVFVSLGVGEHPSPVEVETLSSQRGAIDFDAAA